MFDPEASPLLSNYLLALLQEDMLCIACQVVDLSEMVDLPYIFQYSLFQSNHSILRGVTKTTKGRRYLDNTQISRAKAGALGRTITSIQCT